MTASTVAPGVGSILWQSVSVAMSSWPTLVSEKGSRKRLPQWRFMISRSSRMDGKREPLHRILKSLTSSWQ